MNTAINSVMRGNVSTHAASGLFKIPITTLQKLVEAARLQQKLQNDTIGKISNTKPGYKTDLLTQKKKTLWDRLKDLARR
jgi:predicted RecA/RadA family phage recombinase